MPRMLRNGLSAIWFLPLTFLSLFWSGPELASAGTCTHRDYCTVSNPFYTSGYGGQCTSYAWGRAWELFDVNLSPRGNAGTWVDHSVTDLSTGEELAVDNSIAPNSIAVWRNGTAGTSRMLRMSLVIR